MLEKSDTIRVSVELSLIFYQVRFPHYYEISKRNRDKEYFKLYQTERRFFISLKHGLNKEVLMNGLFFILKFKSQSLNLISLKYFHIHYSYLISIGPFIGSPKNIGPWIKSRTRVDIIETKAHVKLYSLKIFLIQKF